MTRNKQAFLNLILENEKLEREKMLRRYPKDKSGTQASLLKMKYQQEYFQKPKLSQIITEPLPSELFMRDEENQPIKFSDNTLSRAQALKEAIEMGFVVPKQLVDVETWLKNQLLLVQGANPTIDIEQFKYLSNNVRLEALQKANIKTNLKLKSSVQDEMEKALRQVDKEKIAQQKIAQLYKPAQQPSQQPVQTPARTDIYDSFNRVQQSGEIKYVCKTCPDPRPISASSRGAHLRSQVHIRNLNPATADTVQEEDEDEDDDGDFQRSFNRDFSFQVDPGAEEEEKQSVFNQEAYDAASNVLDEILGSSFFQNITD
jgi:hypothetical protein